MRLFVSFFLPEHVAEHLDAAVRSVDSAAPNDDGNGRPALRWVPYEQRHITLAFYGEVPAGAVGALVQDLETALAQLSPLDLRLRGAGVFTSRTLWAGVQETGRMEHSSTSSPLIDLMALCDHLGGRHVLNPEAGAVRERRRAHLTLARARDRRKGEEQLRLRAEALSVYAGPAWTASEAQLVLSELGQGKSGGPLYSTLAEFPLSGG